MNWPVNEVEQMLEKRDKEWWLSRIADRLPRSLKYYATVSLTLDVAEEQGRPYDEMMSGTTVRRMLNQAIMGRRLSWWARMCQVIDDNLSDWLERPITVKHGKEWA